MEEAANQFRTVPIGLCCITVLLELDVIGTSSKCCQLRKQEFLMHQCVTSGSICNSFTVFLTPNCCSYDAAELLQSLQNCNGCCGTVTVAAELWRLLQNCQSCRTVTVAAELSQLLQKSYGRYITVMVAEMLGFLKN